jgi:hypothetical protein
MCREEFTAENPATRTVVLSDDEGEAVWQPLCRPCAEELEASEAATQHQ